VSEFDRYGGGEYERALERAISIGGQDAGFYNEVKAKRLIDLARRRLGDPATLSVLDVGAGIGLMDEHLTSTFGRVVGLDVSQQMVERAAERNPERSTSPTTVSPSRSIPARSTSSSRAASSTTLSRRSAGGSRPRWRG
jgi:ubiquinone/menaquinone biosynthesis C-methylase UbiE